jgi:hypothetical protein
MRSRQDSLYRCKKCRRLVATQQNVVSVPEGAARRRSFLNTWGVRPNDLGGAPPFPDVPVVACFASLAAICTHAVCALRLHLFMAATFGQMQC